VALSDGFLPSQGSHKLACPNGVSEDSSTVVSTVDCKHADKKKKQVDHKFCANPEIGSVDVSEVLLINQPTALPQSLVECCAENWITFLPELKLSGVAKTLAYHCTVSRSLEGEIWLVLDQAYDTLYNSMNHTRIEQAIKQYFSTEIVLHVNSGKVPSETPAMYIERQDKICLTNAKMSIQKDENVLSLVRQFGAKLDDTSVIPLKN